MMIPEEKCFRCGKKALVTDMESKEVFCSKCGTVIYEKVNESRAERFFTDSYMNKSHMGVKTSLAKHDRGLNTMINPSDRDSTGTPLPDSMKSTLKRLRKWDSRSRSRTADERNLQQALPELLKLKEKLSLPDAVIEKAAYVYRKALEKNLSGDALL